MFNKDFYPTPANVIEKMIEFADIKKNLSGSRLTILEPSAGKGDILDYLKANHFRHSKPNLICFEKEPELQSILQEKGFNLIGSDFLSESCVYSPDIIIMNPPFSEAHKHFIRAFELLKTGTLICLLNAETIRNPSSREKIQVNEIINQNSGKVEFLGDCFSGAQRKTSVEVALVVISKESESKSYFNTSNFEKEHFKQADDMSKMNEIELRDIFSNRESRYKACAHAFQEISSRVKEFMKMLSEIKGHGLYDERIRNLVFSGDFNSFISEFNSSAWDRLLDESKFKTLLTQRTKDDFLEKFNNQKSIAFTRENMIVMFQTLFENKGDILSSCIVEVFDYFTKYHDENRLQEEGWKTNSHYKVNTKIILPYMIERVYSGRYEIRYNYRQNVEDIDRALCFISGQSFSHIVTIKQALETKFKEIENGESEQKICSSEFFDIKFFKKGTLHLKFKSAQIWQRFNQVVAELKGYPLQEASSKQEHEPNFEQTKEAKEKQVKRTNKRTFSDGFLQTIENL